MIRSTERFFNQLPKGRRGEDVAQMELHEKRDKKEKETLAQIH
jgi:hypothetical protein